MNADAGAVVAGVGEGGQARGGGVVRHGQSVNAGGGDVMHRARLGLRNPEWEPVGGKDRLDVAPVGVRLAGVL
jgi:hypothetical protein